MVMIMFIDVPTFSADGQRVCLAQRHASSQIRATLNDMHQAHTGLQDPYHISYQNVLTGRVGWAKAVSAIQCACAAPNSRTLFPSMLYRCPEFSGILPRLCCSPWRLKMSTVYLVQCPVLLKFFPCGSSLSQMIRHQSKRPEKRSRRPTFEDPEHPSKPFQTRREPLLTMAVYVMSVP